MKADHEAVEAVSEILSRATDGMVSVEAPFDLVDDGLAVRVDPTRPVTVRAYAPAAHAGDSVERARMRLWTKQLDESVHAATRTISNAIAFRYQMLALGT